MTDATNTQTTDIIIRSWACECGREIGMEVIHAGHHRLLIAGGYAWEHHETCACCGRVFHWSASDRAFERLMSRYPRKPAG